MGKTCCTWCPHGQTSKTGRLVLGIRHLISLPAGLTRMNFATFSFYTCLGAAVWSLVLVLMGYFIGGNEAVIKENLPYLTAAILLSVGAILGAYYWWQKR
jgi:membrane protein DedA with SNARE-associated domain